jgi:hypothetical protein
MQHSSEQQALDLANAKAGVCPECLTDLSKQDAAAHAELEWPELTLRDNPVSDAHRRKALVLAYAKMHPPVEKPVSADPRIALAQQADAAMVEKPANEVAKVEN